MQKLYLLIGFILLGSGLTFAQEEIPAPQFLYRDGNYLILLDGYTGETSELSFEVTESDRFQWSPDGRYILALQNRDSTTFTYCLNLYELDTQSWISSEPIACTVKEATFSADSSQIVYSTVNDDNAVLWLYNLEQQVSQAVYRIEVDGENLHETGISSPGWSPTEKYLTFTQYHGIMGGTLNSMIVLNLQTREHLIVRAPDSYYASYNPVWSENDDWFLISLKDEYITSSTLPVTNHQGDVYMFNSETGEQYRITYTPASNEYDIHWTEEGDITFTEIIERELTYTLEEAMTVEVVSRDDIVTPEPFDRDSYYKPLYGILISPDTGVGAWTTSTSGSYELHIGSILSRPHSIWFSVSLSETGQNQNILIGWRPSSYVYSQG